MCRKRNFDNKKDYYNIEAKTLNPNVSFRLNYNYTSLSHHNSQNHPKILFIRKNIVGMKGT